MRSSSYTEITKIITDSARLTKGFEITFVERSEVKNSEGYDTIEITVKKKSIQERRRVTLEELWNLLSNDKKGN